MKRLSSKEFKHIYSKVTRLCIDLVIKNKDGILFTKRGITPWKGMWHLPGGTVLFHESLENASRRIAKGELNLKIKIIKVVGTMEFFRNKYHAVSVAFLAKPLSNKIKLDRQATEFRYFKKPDKNTIKEHKKFIEGLKL